MKTQEFLLTAVLLVITAATPLLHASPTLTLTVSTDKPSYLVEENVRILGNLTHNGSPVQDWPVALEVQDPTNSPVVTRTLQTDTNGKYNLNFKLPTNAKIGTYTVYVSSNYKGETATNNTTFELIPAQFTLTTLYEVNLYVNGTFVYGNNMTVKFYSYHGVYQGEVAVWNGTTPAYVFLSKNISHPLNQPIENAILVLTDDLGNILQTVTFLVHRTHLFGRITQIDARWPFALPEERTQLFKEIVDIDMQWLCAPP